MLHTYTTHLPFFLCVLLLMSVMCWYNVPGSWFFVSSLGKCNFQTDKSYNITAYTITQAQKKYRASVFLRPFLLFRLLYFVFSVFFFVFCVFFIFAVPPTNFNNIAISAHDAISFRNQKHTSTRTENLNQNEKCMRNFARNAMRNTHLWLEIDRIQRCDARSILWYLLNELILPSLWWIRLPCWIECHWRLQNRKNRMEN